MKLRRLRLVNYRRYEDVTFELGDGVTALIGRNGSGKSTLLEALGFALFGTPAIRTPRALLRREDAAPADPVEVELDLELSGQAVELRRSLRGANMTPSASLSIDGNTLVAPGGNSSAAVTSEVERLLGMDRKAFFTTIVAQQKDLDRLAKLSGPDRKQLILHMLGVDALDRAIAAGRERRRTAQAALDGLRDALPDVDLMSLRKQWATARKALDKQRESCEKTVARAAKTLAETKHNVAVHEEAWKDHEDRVAAARDAARRAAEAEKALLAAVAARDASAAAAASLAQLEPTAAKAPEAAAALAAAQAHESARRLHEQAHAARHRLQTRRTELEASKAGLTRIEIPADGDVEATADALRKADAEWATAKQEAARLETQWRTVADADADAPCPLCLRPLDAHAERLRHQLQREATAAGAAAAAAERKKQALQSGYDEACRAREAHRQATAAAQAQANETTRIEQELARLAAELDALALPPDPGPAPDLDRLTAHRDHTAQAALEVARLSMLAGEAEARRLTATRLETESAQCKRASEEALAALGDGSALQARLAAARKQLEAAQKHDKDAGLDLARASAAMEASDAELRRLDAQEAEHARIKQLVARRRRDVETWTALTAGRGQGILERFRSHLIGKIRPAINQEASRLLATFTHGRYTELLLDEDYGLYLSDGGVPFTVDRFSGGETDLVHLALRIAVSRLLAERHGAPELRFLALDEVFGSLDRSRRDAVLAALGNLGGTYSQILLVTHQEDLRDALDHVVEVVEDDGVAALRVHQG